jgi:predicted RNase H-like HicB family nuclease
MRQEKSSSKHEDGYVAYPVGIKGVVVGEGNTYEAALHDVQSALKFHLETFGADALEGEEGPVLKPLWQRQPSEACPNFRSIQKQECCARESRVRGGERHVSLQHQMLTEVPRPDNLNHPQSKAPLCDVCRQADIATTGATSES